MPRHMSPLLPPFVLLHVLIHPFCSQLGELAPCHGLGELLELLNVFETLYKKGVRYLLTEGNLTLGGKHTMQYICDMLLNCTLETYLILLISVTPII